MTEMTFYQGEMLDPAKNKNIPETIDPYIPGSNLVEAVKLAQILSRPLLVKGEPGCGKTRLAEAVAFELFGSAYKDNYFEWHVKSNSKAQEGLYVINHLKRLHDANLKKEASLDITLGPDEIKGEYLELGPLGKAFVLTRKMADHQPPPVVLIDEVDKADIDFPNDLLLEIDQMKFEIPETDDGTGNPIVVEANRQKKPLIIITSNDEKPLPAAFLRRCLFHYIEYPTAEMLRRIVNAKFPRLDEDLAESATDMFATLRGEIEKAGTAIKNISTSELLDWVKILAFYQQPAQRMITVDYKQALAKDVETVQIFMKFDEAQLKKYRAEKETANEPALVS